VKVEVNVNVRFVNLRLCVEKTRIPLLFFMALNFFFRQSSKAIKISSTTLLCTCMQVERAPRRKCARTAGPTVVVVVCRFRRIA